MKIDSFYVILSVSLTIARRRTKYTLTLYPKKNENSIYILYVYLYYLNLSGHIKNAETEGSSFRPFNNAGFDGMRLDIDLYY